MDNFLDNIIMGILTPIMNVIGGFFDFIFSSKPLTITFALLFINLIAFYLMYLDKKHAKEEKRRISEKTLFLTALAFGSVGILAGMYKFRHKTLHKSFTIGIPLILGAQIIFIIYTIIKGGIA